MRFSPSKDLMLAMGDVPAGIDAEFVDAYARYNARSPELGDTTATAAGGTPTAAAPGFMDGLKTWKNPIDGFGALKDSLQGDVTANLAYVGGLAVPPLVVLMLLMGGGRRRFF